MNKNKLLTFIFALIPGAGQMYLGLMKKGVIVMLSFVAVIFVAMALYMEFVLFLLPIIWFYSFFDTMNLRHLSTEEIGDLERQFISSLDVLLAKDWSNVLQRRHLIIGISSIALGAYILFANFVRPILYNFSGQYYWIGNIINAIPTLLIALTIIIIGLHLIKGDRKSKSHEKDYIEYRGEDDEQ